MGNSLSDKRAHYANEAGSRSTPPAYIPPPAPVDMTLPPVGQIIHPEPVLPPNPGQFGVPQTTGYAHDKNYDNQQGYAHNLQVNPQPSSEYGRSAQLHRTE